MTSDKFHERLLGIRPTEALVQLYLSSQARGWHDAELSPEKLLGVFMLALHTALPIDGSTFQRTFLLLPSSAEAWVTERIRVLVRYMLSRQPATGPVYNIICQAVSATWFASRVYQIDEPARWVAFGFGPGNPTPSWLNNRLLEKSNEQ